MTSSILVNQGILLLKDVSGPMKTWWFSIPGVSSFKREFIKGWIASYSIICTDYNVYHMYILLYQTYVLLYEVYYIYNIHTISSILHSKHT